MPIVFEVFYEDGSKDSVTQWIDEEDEDVIVPNPGMKEVSFVLFDPGSRILKTVDFKKALQEWAAQEGKPPNSIGAKYDPISLVPK